MPWGRKGQAGAAARTAVGCLHQRGADSRRPV
jgi:hypothetical protein